MRRSSGATDGPKEDGQKKRLHDKGRQKVLDSLAVYLARNKSPKELDELMAAAETNEQKTIVRLAKKLRKDWR